MKKILIILPVSIGGSLVSSGFGDAFSKLGYFIVQKDIRDLSFEEIENLNPDFIFNYCYGYLNDEKLTEKLYKNKNYKFIHYFADEPNSKFAYTDKPQIYDLIKNSNDYIFTWDKEFINSFKKAHYLPLAINPQKYKTQFEGYKHSISLVIRPLSQSRQNLLVTLIKTFGKISFFCYREHYEKCLDELIKQNVFSDEELENFKASYKGFLKTENELAQIYNSSKININLTEQGKTSLNYRVFEVLASSGFLLTDTREDIYSLFDVGRELDVFKNEAQLFDKINFYLKNLNLAQAIARNGRKNVVNNHTFKERAEKMLKIIAK